jgi:hypothetical protein
MPYSEKLIRRQAAEQMQETFASALNAVTWALLRKPDRTADEDEKMLYAAFASAYHYLETGSALEQQRAEWLISRVYSVLGNGPEALKHAQRCNELTEKHGDELADYDSTFALEALARAHTVLDNADEAAGFRAKAEEAGKAISDEQSRMVFMDELQA